MEGQLSTSKPTPRYKPDLASQMATTWFRLIELCRPPRRYSAFEIVGGWANTGFSLVDQNLVAFQKAYPLLIFMIWLALAGNTGFVSVFILDFPFFFDQPAPQPILCV